VRTFFCRIIPVLFPLCTAFSADYFPLEVGNTWTYSTVSPQVNVSYVMTASKKLLNGVDSVYCMSNKVDFGGIVDSLDGYMLSDGNDIFVFDEIGDAKPYDKIFEHQPVAGHEWMLTTGETRKIVSCGTITVPAGTFQSCYAVVEDGDTTEIYAPDVGMIVMADRDELAVHLASYTLPNSNPVRFPPRRISVNQSSGYPASARCVDLQGRLMGAAAGMNGLRNSGFSSGMHIFYANGTLPSDGNRQARTVMMLH